MKADPRKFRLHENDFYEKNGKITRFGKGSFYRINSFTYSWIRYERKEYHKLSIYDVQKFAELVAKHLAEKSALEGKFAS